MYKEIFSKAAKRSNLLLEIINEKSLTGRIIYPNGKKTIFFGNDLGLNPSSSSELVQDKYQCAVLLRLLGFNAPETYLIKLKPDTAENDRDIPELNWDEIEIFSNKIGYPFFIKPNMGTEGAGIFKIKNFEQIGYALKQLENVPSVVLQKACRGDTEYRVVVLNGQIQMAYKREPFYLIGNGADTINQLLKTRIQELKDEGRSITLQHDDPKIDFELAVQDLGRFHTPAGGEKIIPLANLNLSEGSFPVECTEEIRENFSDLCIKLHTEMGLNFFGIDLMVDWSLEQPDYDIIEINRKPGFTNFAASSIANYKIVQSVFDRAFESLADKAQMQPITKSKISNIPYQP